VVDHALAYGVPHGADRRPDHRHVHHIDHLIIPDTVTAAGNGRRRPRQLAAGVRVSGAGLVFRIREFDCHRHLARDEWHELPEGTLRH